MQSYQDSIRVFQDVWPHICSECRQVLGSELHYQAMMYHCFRDHGDVPLNQIGMNVKIWIDNPITSYFRTHDSYKHKDYQGGVEPIPDIVLFKPEIEGDYRRRNKKNTLNHMLMAIEVKASERAQSRLMPGEIIEDILKLEAFRNEARRRGTNFVPTMVVIDTAPDKKEQMTEYSLQLILEEAEKHNVGLFYLSKEGQEIVEWNISKLSIQ